MTLREIAEQAARDIPHYGGPAHPTEAIADCIERVAKAFAERALREAICEWSVINCGDQAWCDKRIAEAIAAAEH